MLDINRRVEEIFARGAEGAVNDTELMNCINSIRFNRFESALRTVLDGYSGESSAPVVAKPNPPPPPSGAHGTTQYDPRTNTMVRVSPQQQQQSNAIAAAKAVADADETREYVRRVLGHYYMEMHGVGEHSHGFNVQIEDARVVLKAFWVMSESRLHTDVESTIDQMILQKISERIEQELLSQLQLWSGNSESLTEMLSENVEVTRKRSEYLLMKTQYNEALKKIHEISPQTIADMASAR